MEIKLTRLTILSLIGLIIIVCLAAYFLFKQNYKQQIQQSGLSTQNTSAQFKKTESDPEIQKKLTILTESLKNMEKEMKDFEKDLNISLEADLDLRLETPVF